MPKKSSPSPRKEPLTKNEQSMGVVVDNPNTIIPKLCNRMNIAKDNNGNIVITMFFVDNNGKDHILINRVFIDKTHAAEVANILQKLVQ